MTGSPELLEFYLVEATEYLDSLDQLVVGTGGAPDGNAFIATARALRGASTMAKADAIGTIAGAIEQIAHAVRDGDVRWTMDLHGALRQTVDDLRFLVRGVRTWGERESVRAEARVADLQRFLPTEQARQASPAAAATAPVFIALQSSAIAAELDAFVGNPSHRRALDDALTRTRTMRGIAGIADFPPLPDVADAIDRTARALMPDAPLSDGEVELFRAAADVLRRTSARLRDGSPPLPNSPEVARFARAVAALQAPAPNAGEERVVQIDELFYADAGPHILQRSAAPPTSRLQRFRDESMSRAEHIRRLVSDARQVHDLAASDRAARALRSALLDLEGVSASFDVHQVSSFFGEAARENDLLAPALLEALEAGALLLLTPGESIEEIERRLAVLERARRVTPRMTPAVATPISTPAVATPISTPASATISPPVSRPTPVTVPIPSVAPTPTPVAVPAQMPVPVRVPVSTPVPMPIALPTPVSSTPSLPIETSASVPVMSSTRASHSPRRPPPTPTGRDLQDFLQEGIAGLNSLDEEPLSEPARLDEDDIVPIESLVYRGPSAVRRAIEVRDAMRARGRTDDATLQEIFDLLDLAQAE